MTRQATEHRQSAARAGLRYVTDARERHHAPARRRRAGPTTCRTASASPSAEIRKPAERARHPAGVDRRVDLSGSRRPHPGHGARRARAQAVPLPRAVSRGARPARSSAACWSSARRCRCCASASSATCAAQDLSRKQLLATVVRLLDRTLIRVGNDEYARENRSYGLTTLRRRHVRVDGAMLRFSFRGKSGVEHSIAINDPRLARIVQRCQRPAGRGAVPVPRRRRQAPVGVLRRRQRVLRALTGRDITAKDFRTWGGTMLAAMELRRMGPAASRREADRNIIAAVDAVAERLGNTRAVCRKYYVHPALLQAYLMGRVAPAPPRHHAGATSASRAARCAATKCSCCSSSRTRSKGAAHHQRRLRRRRALAGRAGADPSLARRPPRRPGARRPVARRPVRASGAFIAGAGWASFAEVEAQFKARDAAFRRAGEHDEIVLWFEHDLYDQLQLIQVLDGLSALRGPPISLVCEAEYLGNMAPERAAELFVCARPVTRRHFQEAQAAWAAFRSSDPLQIDPVEAEGAAVPGRGLAPPPRRVSVDQRRPVAHQRRSAKRSRTARFRCRSSSARRTKSPHFSATPCSPGMWKRLDRWLPRWLGGYEVKDETRALGPGASEADPRLASRSRAAARHRSPRSR